MFTATKPLPLTMPTTIGESATSFASRLARRNGVPRLIAFCSDVGIDYFALVNGDPLEIQRMAVLGDIDPVPLQASTPSLIEAGWFQLGNEHIKFRGLIRTTLRICPRCIHEAPDRTGIIHHGVWQVAAIRTCQKHGCHLVAVPKPKTAMIALITSPCSTALNQQPVIWLCLRIWNWRGIRPIEFRTDPDKAGWTACRFILQRRPARCLARF